LIFTIPLNCQTNNKIYLIGEDLSGWRQDPGEWRMVGEVKIDPKDEESLTAQDGAGVIINGATGKTVDIFSKEEFGDVKVHVEFMVPKNSNSGVYFMGRYEIQVFDSYGKEKVEFSDCGGIYQRWDENRNPKGYEGHPPRVNAAKPAGEWQNYDVIFRAPRFDSNDHKVQNAKFEKVVFNGIVIHENVEVTGSTRAAAYNNEKAFGPLMLQGDHGPVAYRNIWVESLK
jgi:hypothetical protein